MLSSIGSKPPNDVHKARTGTPTMPERVCTPPTPRDQPVPPKDWMTPKDLADWLGVPVKSVYVWNQNGTGPYATRIGKHCRFSRPAVIAWLAERESTNKGLYR